MKKPTKIQQAIDFITLNGSARTDALAKHLEIPEGDMAAYIGAAVRDGRLVTCKIEIPGRRPMNEYRIGSGIPDSYKDLKVTKAITPIRPSAPTPTAREIAATALATSLQVSKAIPARNSRAMAKAPLLVVSEATERRLAEAELQQPSQVAGAPQADSGDQHRQPEAESAFPPSADLAVAKTTPRRQSRGGNVKPKFALDSDGQLAIDIDADNFCKLNPEQTLALGDFLHQTQGVWRP